jgi:hypothetical protein
VHVRICIGVSLGTSPSRLPAATVRSSSTAGQSASRCVLRQQGHVSKLKEAKFVASGRLLGEQKQCAATMVEMSGWTVEESYASGNAALTRSLPAILKAEFVQIVDFGLCRVVQMSWLS